MIQLVLILEIFGLQVDFNGCRSKSWSLRWHQAGDGRRRRRVQECRWWRRTQGSLVKRIVRALDDMVSECGGADRCWFH